MNDLRDEAYHWSLELVEKGYKLPGIFLLLSTWNFANFRFNMIDFDLNNFVKKLDHCDFEFFKNEKFETINLSDPRVTERIKDIYETLSKFRGVRYVGATKIMHLVNPHVFVMWDNCIMSCYKAKKTPEGYVEFFHRMQQMYKANKFQSLGTGVTIPRAIDIYNIEKCHDTEFCSLVSITRKRKIGRVKSAK